MAPFAQWPTPFDSTNDGTGVREVKDKEDAEERRAEGETVDRFDTAHATADNCVESDVAGELGDGSVL